MYIIPFRIGSAGRSREHSLRSKLCLLVLPSFVVLSNLFRFLLVLRSAPEPATANYPPRSCQAVLCVVDFYFVLQAASKT